MRRSRTDLRINERIDELLADSVIQAVMRADHIDPTDSRAIWRAAADKLQHDRSQGGVPPDGGQRPDTEQTKTQLTKTQQATTQRTKPWGAAWRKRLTSGPAMRSQFCGQE
ncbi:hypothetical protein PY365_00630 [Roseiarcaceae bacterium H3SJ34-1]|uniref:hypothetical protein n=1 Tax=Terripilifer ovatus TaxID=3032367 RepID=UPI003AB95934|nr:hypothetical protein [Roseiarcaceae bacterium H3SJ34-1]